MFLDSFKEQRRETWIKNYGDIPVNHTVTINCLIHNNHIPYAYNPNKFREHDAEIGFMWGRGLGVDVNLEEADSYFRQAYERANDSKLNESEKQLINLVGCPVLCSNINSLV